MRYFLCRKSPININNDNNKNNGISKKNERNLRKNYYKNAIYIENIQINFVAKLFCKYI